MNKKLKNIGLLLFTLATLSTQAQTTVQSPYSKFGIGNLKGSALPQLRGMGNISTGIYRSSSYDNINTQNPASYAGINFTVLDIGMAGTASTLKTSNLTEKNFNSTLSHLNLAFPITNKSALSFGILPYSELGYNFKNSVQVGNNASNYKTANYIYSGEGGLSNAYIGYGIQLGEHFRVGLNAEYLFGNLIQSSATEYVNEPGSLNSKNQSKNSVSGVNFNYGLQYDIPLDKKTTLTIGYSGTAPSKFHSELSKYSTIYRTDMTGAEQAAIDTLDYIENGKTNLKLPLTNSFGFSIHKENKWLVGADYRMGQWSKMSINNINQNLTNTQGFSVGGQFTPDITAINGYFKRVDYRLGFSYDKTYVQMNGQNINQTAFTFGLGLPLSSYARSSFYKLNLSTEIGKRGKIGNGLIQEGFINFHLGFMLNDRWFQRFKFD